jgi:hypothetical protein
MRSHCVEALVLRSCSPMYLYSVVQCLHDWVVNPRLQFHAGAGWYKVEASWVANKMGSRKEIDRRRDCERFVRI